MNWRHFQAFLWLRWRLLINQMRRGGIANMVILTIMAIGGALLAVGAAVSAFVVGLLVLADVSPVVLLYVWDGLIAAFLFSWMIGLLTELQRSEALSPEKFLHLPVSLRGVFLINYLSSLFNLTLLGFLPGIAALSFALVLVRGPRMIWLFPLVAAFILMISAVTYHFQGWLAALMVNKRRRRTVIVVVTMLFVLICQLPNLANLHIWRASSYYQDSMAIHTRKTADLADLQRSFDRKEITSNQYEKRLREIDQEHQAKLQELQQQTSQSTERSVRLANLLLPPGWLALGAMAAAEANGLTALLGILGMTLLGTASLWRSYRTTLRLYTGHFTSVKKAPVAAAAPVKTRPPSISLLERRLPWASERVSAVALGGFRSLLRAPEAKMLLLSPLLMLLVGGSIFLTKAMDLPERIRPLISLGGMAMILLSMGQIAGNQFGFDRSGFRVFVLSAAPRRDILLGKNLACAPFALGMGMLVNLVVQALYPMRFDYFVAIVPLSISMFLLFCLLANCLSIFAPIRLRSGSAQPANLRGLPLVLHLLFLFLFPLALAPTLLPWAIALALEELAGIRAVPVCLMLSLLECGAIIWLYRAVLIWEGDILQAREQTILEVVTTKTE